MVVATGVFDGVHIGHQYLIKELVRLAKENNDKSMVITFCPHPRNVLHKGARKIPILMTKEEKEQILYSLGVDYVEFIEFTESFSSLSAREYLTYIIKKYKATSILLGYDNKMGSDSMTTKQLSELASSLGLLVHILKPILLEKNLVSSTILRLSLLRGDVKEARAMLNYNYSLAGTVIKGDQLGRTLGFPTANMQILDDNKLLPASAIYLVRVFISEEQYYGMCYIGYRPTIAEGLELRVETNIFDFNRDIYGENIRLEFLDKVREDRKFSNLQDLKEQLIMDKETCMSLILALK